MSSNKNNIRKTPGNTEWFIHDRFGMFIHFGLYTMPARHEWVKKIEEISEEKYQKYFDYFNPDMLDVKEWARQAKAAGMKYVVLTTKHHEGFAFLIQNTRIIKLRIQSTTKTLSRNMPMLSVQRA